MKKLQNLSLQIVITFICCVFVSNIQAQDYATAVSLKETKMPTAAKSKTFVASTMTLASFKNDIATWDRYLVENLVYPIEARENTVGGNVVASFEVSANGEVRDIIIEKSLGYGCDEEVKRLLEASPRWNPAMQGNYAVKSRVKVNVRFALER